MRSYWLDLSNPAHRILYDFGLSARGKTQLEILKELSHGSANVYELKYKRLRDIDVHYSTFLRALRVLEKKKLVRVESSREGKRRTKTFALTVLGELVVALTRNGARTGGLSEAGRMLAESSRSIRECIEVHLPFDSNYPLSLAESVISNILKSERAEPTVRSDLDIYMRKAGLEWVKANIVKALHRELLYDPSRPWDARPEYARAHPEYGYYIPFSRSEILRYLKKVTHISWISDYLVQVVEKYVEKEKEWLQGLEDFKREVKLARLHTDKTEQEL